MKANRKFVEEREAVSAVIGVILMVAITVAIVGVLWGYLGGLFGPIAQTPTIVFTTDETNNYIEIQSADTNINWSDMTVTTNTAGTTLAWSTDPTNTTAIGTGSVVCNTIGTISVTTVTAGQKLVLAGATGTITVTFTYTPTNSLIGNSVELTL